MNQINLEHQTLITKANTSIANAQLKVETDPLRPIYHLISAANWISDPNGPIFYKGEYHLFFQHNPYDNIWGNMSWGHAVSNDLVHWKHLPIALTPSPGGDDKDGVFSGCCVINKGEPTILYTGVWPEVQCIARSYDDMKTWIKYPGNPVIATRPREDLEGFRDPFAWKEKDAWYMLIGSGIKSKGGTALLYRSKDLINWNYMHPLCTGISDMWECPLFFPLQDRHILTVSTADGVKYSIGIYENYKFNPGPWHTLDKGGCDGFYAPNSLEDHDSRRIIWGWIKGGGSEGYPWNGILSLPRILSLHRNGKLSITPAPELKKLRGKHYRTESLVLTKTSSCILKNIKDNCLEIIAEFERVTAESFGIEIYSSRHNQEKLKIGYDNTRQHLFSGDLEGSLKLPATDKILALHIFLDRSVIEVYANHQICLTGRYYPKYTDNQSLNLFVRGGTTKIKSVHVWQMKSIW